MTALSHFAERVSDLIVQHAGEWWSYAATAGLSWVDGFFPPLPSESIVIGMASLAHEGRVSLLLLGVCAAVGAWLGDNTAYWIGRLLQLDRLFKGEKSRRALARAEHLLERKGPVVLLVARFVPGVRVVTSMTAGGVRYSWGSFSRITAVSAVVWALQAIGIGLAAGKVFQGNPLLGIAAGVVVGLLVGVVIERVHTAWAARHTSHRDGDPTV